MARARSCSLYQLEDNDAGPRPDLRHPTIVINWAMPFALQPLPRKTGVMLKHAAGVCVAILDVSLKLVRFLACC